MPDVIKAVRRTLINSTDEKTRATSQRFFREKIKYYGVKVPVVNRISKDYFARIESRTKQEIFSLCELLWSSGYIEESFIACNWSYNLRELYEPNDFQVFTAWIQKYVSNWASCDTFCNHTVGTFIEMFPEYLPELKDFARADNRWLRRASAVSLIIPARNGKFINDVLEIADILLIDNDDLVQKGYGWMLKAASEVHQQEIYEFVMARKAVMPRTALRYAIEKMPEKLKAAAMKK